MSVFLCISYVFPLAFVLLSVCFHLSWLVVVFFKYYLILLFFRCLLVSLEEREKERVWIWMDLILFIFNKRKKKEIKNSLACPLSSTAFLAAAETGTSAFFFLSLFCPRLCSLPHTPSFPPCPISRYPLTFIYHPPLHPRLFALCVSKSERSSLISSWVLNSDCSLLSPGNK